MQVFFITLLLLGFAFAAIGIKMFIIKDGVFTKQCSTVDSGPLKNIGCSCGEKSPEERCENYEGHHGKGADTARHIHTERMVVKNW